jgi:hypothetical protein
MASAQPHSTSISKKAIRGWAGSSQNLLWLRGWEPPASKNSGPDLWLLVALLTKSLGISIHKGEMIIYIDSPMVVVLGNACKNLIFSSNKTQLILKCHVTFF